MVVIVKRMTQAYYNEKIIIIITSYGLYYTVF